MPMGPAPFGFAYFAGIKLAGYSASAAFLRKKYPTATAGVFRIGLTRTMIGIVAGVSYGAIWIYLLKFDGPTETALYLALLVPIRLLEWTLLLRLFFDRAFVNRARDFGFASLGTLWSYALDAVGIGAALVIPGGFWVC